MQTWEQMVEARLVGVVRTSDAARARTIAAGLAEGGLEAIEITLTTPGALDTVGALRAQFPKVCWGVGTVRRPEEVEAADQAGAAFIVSPHLDRKIVEAARARGRVVIPGALTPTEILQAWSAGASAVKVFPVSAVGGPAYLRWIRGPLPDVPLWVSGDVELDDIPAFLRAGATLIGLTSALTRDLVEPLTEAAADRARRARAAASSAGLARLVLRGTADLELTADEIRATGSPRPLEDWLPGRIGRVFPLEPWLEASGLASSRSVRLFAADGFEATLPTGMLRSGGAVQVDADGGDLEPSAGGPFRLYIRGIEDRCSNVKGLQRIEVHEA